MEGGRKVDEGSLWCDVEYVGVGSNYESVACMHGALAFWEYLLGHWDFERTCLGELGRFAT